MSRCSRWAVAFQSPVGYVDAEDPGHGRFAEQHGDQAALAAAEVGDPGGGGAGQHGVAEDGEYGVAALVGQRGPRWRGGSAASGVGPRGTALSSASGSVSSTSARRATALAVRAR